MGRIEYLSPSSINSFLNKYPEWHDRYIMGKEIEPNVYLKAGTAVHNFLESFYKENPKQHETIKLYATRVFNTLFKTFVRDNKDLQQFFHKDTITETNLREWLYIYISVWVKEAERLEKKYGTDKAKDWTSPDFFEEAVKDEDLKLRGYIDAIYTNDKWNKMSKALTFTLVDYKTSSKTYQTVPTEYYLQLLIYALLKSKQNKRVDWVAVDYIKYGQKYFFRVTKDQLDRVEQLVNAIWDEVNSVLEMSADESKEYKPKTKMIEYL